jgi:predicted ABC-type ATPase
LAHPIRASTQRVWLAGSWRGGHTVPIEKIVSRYIRSLANLAPMIRLADRVYIYDNSADGEDARLCARTESGLLRKVYGVLPQWGR